MIIKKNRFSKVVLILMLVALPLSGLAQTEAQTSPGAKKAKAANESCDGALDIVPSKSMTFIRKRRPDPKREKKDKNSSDRRSGEKARTPVSRSGIA